MLPHNKGADGVNKKILKELKQEKTKTNIWEYAVGLNGSTSDKIAFKHPAVFPEKLAEDHILSWTNPGDLVFDPMVGSGTTCKMALLNDRQYLGCDISEEYVNITKKRLEQTLEKKSSMNSFLKTDVKEAKSPTQLLLTTMNPEKKRRILQILDSMPIQGT